MHATAWFLLESLSTTIPYTITMTRESGVRNFSLLSLSSKSPKSPPNSADDMKNSPSPRPRRPTSTAREGGQGSRRLSMLGLRAQRSMHDLGATLKDTTSVAHNRLSSLNLGQPTQKYEPSPPLPTPSRRVTQSFLGASDRSPLPPASAGGPRSSRALDAELMPPPPIGGAFPDRSSSPGGSRASSKTRGRRESLSARSPVGSRANSPAAPDFGGPGSPATGKLNKKKTWLPGKSHGRSDSASNANQPWAFIVGTAEKQPYELSYLIKAQPVRDTAKS